MSTFDEFIVHLFEQGLISQETAMAYASRKGIAGRGIDMVKAARGEATTDIDRLEIDHQYRKSTRR
jgi:twitching motility protein PilT